ncbi:hypothetical protein ACR780_12100 [Sphingobacterium faecium]|uniref:hypothetical protein n=1 Tax=Sphingobacterium faecium TaxID=34087 RepID=UPI003DA6C1D8
MNEHIQNLLAWGIYIKDVKEEAVVLLLFNGESVINVTETINIISYDREAK